MTLGLERLWRTGVVAVVLFPRDFGVPTLPVPHTVLCIHLTERRAKDRVVISSNTSVSPFLLCRVFCRFFVYIFVYILCKETKPDSSDTASLKKLHRRTTYFGLLKKDLAMLVGGGKSCTLFTRRCNICPLSNLRSCLFPVFLLSCELHV